MEFDTFWSYFHGIKSSDYNTLSALPTLFFCLELFNGQLITPHLQSSIEGVIQVGTARNPKMPTLPRTYLELKDETSQHWWVERIRDHPWKNELHTLSYNFYTETEFRGETIIWTEETIRMYKRIRRIWFRLRTQIHIYTGGNPPF